MAATTDSAPHAQSTTAFAARRRCGRTVPGWARAVPAARRLGALARPLVAISLHVRGAGAAGLRRGGRMCLRDRALAHATRRDPPPVFPVSALRCKVRVPPRFRRGARAPQAEGLHTTMSSEFPVHPTTPDAGRSPLPPAATTDRARREAPPVEAVIELDWRRWGAAVLRHKWLVLLVTVIGTAGGFGVSRFLRPTYVAQATLWIDLPAAASPGDQGPNPIQSAQLLGPSGWVDLLKSHVVLDSVVDELRLYLTAKSRDDSTVLASFQHAPGGFRPGAYRLDVADTGGT